MDGEMIGRIIGYFLIAFLLVKFWIAKSYYKKHNQKMGPVRFIVWLIVMAVFSFLVSLNA